MVFVILRKYLPLNNNCHPKLTKKNSIGASETSIKALKTPIYKFYLVKQFNIFFLPLRISFPEHYNLY